ncbi:MAG: hypothetical protein K2L54_04520, partial [Clostridiales bacterium]|nr:hypothetical protein [Clostridiales bacterium]
YYSENGAAWSEENKSYTMPNVYRVYYKVERNGYKDHYGSASITIEKIVLSGIHASDITFIYDGAKHGIELEGAYPTDRITYSSEGESEVGEYSIDYVVEREYGEYRGECKLTILPNIRGEYVNVENGCIILTDRSAIIGGAEKKLEYDIHGVGKIENDEFKVNGDSLILNGREYEKSAANERVYELNINGRTLYVKGEKSGVDIRVEFNDGNAVIKCGENIIATEDNVNYVEHLAERDYMTSDVTINVIENTSLTLSKRQDSDERDIYNFKVYDGNFHAINAESEEILYIVDGSYTTIPPQYKDCGKYQAEAIIVKDGYLPKLISVTLEIAINIYGAYYNENTLIELSENAAVINNEVRSLNYDDGHWKIDGDVITITENGISFIGTEYIKLAEESLSVIFTSVGIKVIPCESSFYVIAFDNSVGKIEIIDDEDRTVYEYSVSTTIINVVVNGELIPAIPDENGCMFIIGASELLAAKITKIEIVEV